MPIHEFSVIATGLDPTDPAFERRFFEAGCEDAMVSFQRGHIIVDFAREAVSIIDALHSAQRDVERAGAVVERIEPDPLVSLSDMAERTGMTRQAITNYASGQRREDFPAPIARVTSTSPLWDWAEAAAWFGQLGVLPADDVVQARAVADANRELARHRRPLLVP
jgi:predicted DNA-binding transcriptional regulator AlpA